MRKNAIFAEHLSPEADIVKCKSFENGIHMLQKRRKIDDAGQRNALRPFLLEGNAAALHADADANLSSDSPDTEQTRQSGDVYMDGTIEKSIWCPTKKWSRINMVPNPPYFSWILFSKVAKEVHILIFEAFDGNNQVQKARERGHSPSKSKLGLYFKKELPSCLIYMIEL